MEARQIAVQLRRDPREVAERHSQANPLTLSCTLARGETVAENVSLFAELHSSRTPASSPLAAAGPVAMVAGTEGPWELDFTAAQMNQTVLPDEDSEFWLVVYAVGTGDALYTLATVRLTLQYDNISQTTPAPPEPALIFAFRTIAVAGQSSIVADSSADTLTIAAGDGITLTTNPGTDTLTISSNASGSGDVVGPASATDDALARFDGTTGKLIQSSTATLTDAGLLTVSDAAVTGTLTAPHIHGNLAGSIYSHVRNESGGPLTKGTPVYITGYSVGQSRALVAAAASGNSASMPAIGILDADLANNESGHCVVFGTIENLDTSSYQVNAPLYVASGGGLTATEPTARIQPIAQVERVNANNGSILVLTALYGSLAQQSAGAVSITGGSITGLTNLTSTIGTFSTSLSVTSSTASTSTTSGALVVTGGVGIGGSLYVGADSFVNGNRVGNGGGNIATNTAFGVNTLNANTTGLNNTAVGNSALAANTTGIRNTAIGSRALYFASTENSSLTAVGFEAFANLTSLATTGSSVAIGSLAGRYFGSGTSNLNTCTNSIFIGTGARPANNGSTNQIVIGGLDVVGDGNNTTVLGSTGTFTTRINGTATSVLIVAGNEVRVLNSSTPASATATGTTGGIRWDTDYLYVATATNTWKRVKIRTWPNDELPISEGGTGASTAAGARASLGLETVVDDATTARTLASADAAKYIRFTSTSAITITIPTNATDPIPIGSEYFIRRASTGAISLSNAGVTVNNSDIANLATGRVCCLKKVATDTWDYI